MLIVAPSMALRVPETIKSPPKRAVPGSVVPLDDLEPETKNPTSVPALPSAPIITLVPKDVSPSFTVLKNKFPGLDDPPIVPKDCA